MHLVRDKMSFFGRSMEFFYEDILKEVAKVIEMLWHTRLQLKSILVSNTVSLTAHHDSEYRHS
jgi:hypothetical protein